MLHWTVLEIDWQLQIYSHFLTNFHRNGYTRVYMYTLSKSHEEQQSKAYVTGFMETIPNHTWEVTRQSILKHYNQPRIVSTWTKLTQKVDHFTVFESLPSTSCCLQKFLPNKIEKLAGWTCDAISRMFTMGGWQGWTGRKSYSSKLW